MSLLITAFDGPLAIVEENDGRTIVLTGENTSAAAVSAAAAASYADEAAASAASAVAAATTSATSTTSLTIGLGAKSLTIQTGKAFVVGQFVVIAQTTAPANYMQGQITAHNSGTGALTVNVTNIGGSGTISAWTISVSAPGGGGTSG